MRGSEAGSCAEKALQSRHDARQQDRAGRAKRCFGQPGVAILNLLTMEFDMGKFWVRISVHEKLEIIAGRLPFWRGRRLRVRRPPLRLQAMALEQQGKLPEAVEAWRAVTEHNPQDAGAFASLGVVLARETQYKEAAAAYRKAIALNPRLPGIQLNLGLAEYKQGQFQAAIAPLRAALLQDPQNHAGAHSAWP